MTPVIDAIFVGVPKTLSDAQGSWRSSIERDRVDGAVHVMTQGIAGDQVTQLYHGSPDAALCVHLADHYRFWRERYSFTLPPGAVGENLTVNHLSEEEVCVGDIVRLGTALTQVSGPRVPCANQGRHIGRADWVRLTIRENRTGFYMRVLEPGIMQPCDKWILAERFDGKASIPAINHCMYTEFDVPYANRMLHMTGLGDWWREQAAAKLALGGEHWTSRMRENRPPAP